MFKRDKKGPAQADQKTRNHKNKPKPKQVNETDMECHLVKKIHVTRTHAQSCILAVSYKNLIILGERYYLARL